MIREAESKRQGKAADACLVDEKNIFSVLQRTADT